MEIENYLPEPDEVCHHNDTDEKNRRLQFSLLRGYSLGLQEPADFVFPPSSCRRRSIEQILGTLPRPVASSVSREDIITANPDEDLEKPEDIEPQVVTTRRATISAGTTKLNPFINKRTNKLWDWPFGEAKLKNEEDFFELELRIGEFKPEEVSAKVVGKELIIHCKPNSDRYQTKERIPKEIFRCYQLPLNVPPVASDVSIVKDDHWIRVAVRQESALKSPIGIFTPEMAQVLEEEQVADVEDEVEDVHMDGD